jgi:predicted nucleic acid-binding protein
MGVIAFPPGSRVGIDTNVLIYTIEQLPPYSAALVPLWEAAERGDVRLYVSALALPEVLVKPLQIGDTQLEQTYRNLLLGSEALRCVDIDIAVLECAASLRASSGTLKLPDAIHIATALLQQCTHFLTNDRRLRQVTGLDVLILDDLVREPA